MPAPADLIHQTTTGTGTGDLSLTSVNGKRDFSEFSGSFDYFISNRAAAEWEIGTTSLVSGLLDRTTATIIASSNSDALVDFSAGTKDVTNDVLARFQTEWGMQPIGVPIPVWTHITGVEAPPNDPDTGPVYILLTAGEDGMGEYNENLLDGESVSGSAPLVIATATVNLAASPIDNKTVQLINTERRFLRAGSSGTAEADALQGHIHNQRYRRETTLAAGAARIAEYNDSLDITGTGTTTPVTDGTNGTPRTANETRSKNVGATYYMRIL